MIQRHNALFIAVFCVSAAAPSVCAQGTLRRPLAVTQAPLAVAPAAGGYVLATASMHLDSTAKGSLKIRQLRASLKVDGETVADGSDPFEWFFLLPGRKTDLDWDISDAPVTIPKGAKTVTFEMAVEYDEVPSTGFRISDVTYEDHPLGNGKFEAKRVSDKETVGGQ